jgi:APA family basic amino acid/polyamine antiporter
MTTLAAPRPTLTVLDTAALIVGVVIGAGIFKTPELVAANTGTPGAFMLVWLLGGVISLIGALCYAELATTYPHAGGDYHYLTRAFGRSAAFLFAWARMTVIQTGSIALQAFLIGDYASELLRLGQYSPSVYAGLVIVMGTALNLVGLRPGKWTQIVLSGATVVGLLFVALAGLGLVTSSGASPPPAASAPANPSAALGLAMVFVLLTYGGWNEAACLSGELQDVRRNMVRGLFWGIGIVTVVYLLVNLAYLRGLGITGMAGTEVVAAELMRRTLGEGGAALISLLIVVAALSTINGTIITGARTNYALGQDFSMFRPLGRWNERAATPANALLAQGGVALALVLLGTLTPEHGGRVFSTGFTMMVAYTTPVFWFFFLMVGLSLFVLRKKEGQTVRPFEVPLYPLTPLLFCAICLYMLWSSLAYTRAGAWVGVAVLFAGVPLLLLARARPPLSQGK